MTVSIVEGEAAAITLPRVLRIAVPVMLSNAMVPLQGAIDTAIIGNTGGTVPLAAVTMGTTAIMLLFGSFNFLQIGASGLTAQAYGAGRAERAANTLARTLLIALAIAAAINLLSWPIRAGVLALLGASEAVAPLASDYLFVRFLGAPAELGIYALIGWFTGLEMTRRLFEMQVVMSVANVALTFLFVLGFGWRVEGVAAGTACAAYLGLGYGLWRARARLRTLLPAGWRPARAHLLDPGELGRVMALNRDIFVRTLCLVGCFAWMTRMGALQGDAVLAANGVLLQFLFVFANALDGFAMAAETLVGQAIGARSRPALRRAVAVTTVAAVLVAAGGSGLVTLFSTPLIHLFTAEEGLRDVAERYALWATLIPVVAVFAFQFDGVFVGAADGPAMRNAMLTASGVYLPLSWALSEAFGNHGLWAAIWVWMALRALTLALRYPALEARLSAPTASATEA